MQKGHLLQFCCPECRRPVHFSLFDIEKHASTIECSECNLSFDFSDETLLRQLRRFEALCLQLKESEEILSNTAVGIYVGDREIKIPYKLLLTRLNSTLDLNIGGQPMTITFRTEPASEMQSEIL